MNRIVVAIAAASTLAATAIPAFPADDGTTAGAGATTSPGKSPDAKAKANRNHRKDATPNSTGGGLPGGGTAGDPGGKADSHSKGSDAPAAGLPGGGTGGDPRAGKP